MPDFPKIKAKVLYVLSRTDKLFPPDNRPRHYEGAEGCRGRRPLFRDRQRIRPFAGNTDRDWAKWAPALREFLAPLVAGAS